MGQVLHEYARTTAAVRRTIQHSQESLSRLAERYDINPKICGRCAYGTETGTFHGAHL